MALDAVIFDLDGTLIDTNGLHARSWHEALAGFGYNIPEDRVAPEIGKGGDRLVPSVLGEHAAKEQGQALRDAHGKAYLDLISGMKVRVFPGARELIRAVQQRGLKVAIATASKEEHLKKVLEQAELDLFAMADVVVNDDDVDRSKPAPDVVQAAVRKLGLSPAQCVMVGDTPYDAAAAKRAGVVCLGVLTGVHSREKMLRSGMRAVYDDPAGLLAKLDEALAHASPGTLHLTGEEMDRLMEAALEEAHRALAAGEAPIGSVVARGDGTLIARAHNRVRQEGSPLAHAELLALREAARETSEGAGGLILATTLEPCVMCLGAAMEAGVDTVLYGPAAPLNGGVERCEPIRRPGAVMPRLVGGIRVAESRALLEQWTSRHPNGALTKDLLAD